MKRAVLTVAVVALCVAGSAGAQDRGGGTIGSGTRTDDGQVVGSGTLTADSGQILGSGNAVDQMMGSGGFTVTTQDQWLGNGGRADDSGQVMGSGGFTASLQDQYMGSGGAVGQMVGSGGFTTSILDVFMGSGGRTDSGGYLGSGNFVVELELSDGSNVLVVISDDETLIVPIEE